MSETQCFACHRASVDVLRYVIIYVQRLTAQTGSKGQRQAWLPGCCLPRLMWYQMITKAQKGKGLAQNHTAAQQWKAELPLRTPTPRPTSTPPPQADSAHPLLFPLHPTVLLVGVQLPWKPQVLEGVHKGAIQHLL
jgi:hypothetical protein